MWIGKERKAFEMLSELCTNQKNDADFRRVITNKPKLTLHGENATMWVNTERFERYINTAIENKQFDEELEKIIEILYKCLRTTRGSNFDKYVYQRKKLTGQPRLSGAKAYLLALSKKDKKVAIDDGDREIAPDDKKARHKKDRTTADKWNNGTDLDRMKIFTALLLYKSLKNKKQIVKGDTSTASTNITESAPAPVPMPENEAKKYVEDKKIHTTTAIIIPRETIDKNPEGWKNSIFSGENVHITTQLPGDTSGLTLMDAAVKSYTWWISQQAIGRAYNSEKGDGKNTLAEWNCLSGQRNPVSVKSKVKIFVQYGDKFSINMSLEKYLGQPVPAQLSSASMSPAQKSNQAGVKVPGNYHYEKYRPKPAQHVEPPPSKVPHFRAECIVKEARKGHKEIHELKYKSKASLAAKMERLRGQVITRYDQKQDTLLPNDVQVNFDGGQRFYMTTDEGYPTRKSRNPHHPKAEQITIQADENNEVIRKYLEGRGQDTFDCSVVYEELSDTPKRSGGRVIIYNKPGQNDSLYVAKELKKQVIKDGVSTSKETKIIVLNAASETTPGGAPAGGRKAQEESLCVDSALYMWLTGGDMDEYYIQPSEVTSVADKNKFEYNPYKFAIAHGVPVFKKDEASVGIDGPCCEVKTEADVEALEKFDFIMHASRNLNSKVCRQMQPKPLRSGVTAAEEIQHSANQMVKAAVSGGYHGLVVNNLGGGVFNNSIDDWAKAWANAIFNYGATLYVAFAIFENYNQTITSTYSAELSKLKLIHEIVV